VAACILSDQSYEDPGEQSLFTHGCRHLRSQTMKLRPYLSHIIVYLVDFAGLTYVCGFKFVANAGSNYQEDVLGYQSAKYETFKCEQSWNWLTGLVLAVGPRGIHGLHIIGIEGNKSKWAGSWESYPQTQRLVFDPDLYSLSYLVAGFDVSSLGNFLALPTASLANRKNLTLPGLQIGQLERRHLANEY
jgi:hypothetical protein